uniref:Nucleotide-diphospho-sugar transferase domain-containing protein n=1 Tax=Aureoumbra lagunensis TaxID=44058 RepID=A0A7S3NPZ7_9STRA
MKISVFVFIILRVGGIQIRMVTFLDCQSVEKLILPLINKACYAKKQGYKYEVKLLQKRKNTTSSEDGITYKKPGIILEAMHHSVSIPTEINDEFIVWFDVDVNIMNSSRQFDLIDPNKADLWITDHNCNPNNGVIALRNDHRGRSFLKDWIHTCTLGQFPFTDQGCFYQQLIFYASNISLIDTCDLLRTKTEKGPKPMKCVMQTWNHVFGAFRNGHDRIQSRVGLRRADDGFNNHFCHPQFHLKTYCRWYQPPGWSPSTCFKHGMFALHGRSPQRAKKIGLSQSNFDLAATFDPALRQCISSRKATILQLAKQACSSGADSWVNFGAGGQ